MFLPGEPLCEKHDVIGVLLGKHIWLYQPHRVLLHESGLQSYLHQPLQQNQEFQKSPKTLNVVVNAFLKATPFLKSVLMKKKTKKGVLLKVATSIAGKCHGPKKTFLPKNTFNSLLYFIHEIFLLRYA